MTMGLQGRRGLYAIVDPEHCGARDPLAIADAVLQAGCAALQLRDKRGELGATRTLALGLLERCRAAGVPFVLNDRVELAAELRVDGVHLGQDDMPLAEARAQLGREVAIGISTHSLPQALAAQSAGADLIGFGPVFATRSKRDPDPVVGIDGLAQVCARVDIPVVGIGGIDPGRASQVAAAGAAFAAVIGAICSADEPASVAQAIHAAWA